jgi:uncharacterized Zn-binding protein involved in type VI secretion
MERTTKRRSVFGSIAIVLVLACAAAAIGLFLLVSMAATASGTASLPNGATARINGPFSCSTKSQWTTIEAGGHTFTFSPTTVSIDGAAVAALNATVTDIEIDATAWSATLRINGQKIAVPD